MKKSVCLMAILGALGASSAFAAETVAVRFTGTVVNSTCDVVVGSQGNTVHLGQISPEADKTGAMIPVTFSFSNCDHGQTLKTIKYVGGNNGGTDNPTDGTIGTTLKNVKIKLYTESSGKTYTPDVTVNKTFGPDANSAMITPFFARLETGNGKQTDSGIVESSALFELSYQ